MAGLTARLRADYENVISEFLDRNRPHCPRIDLRHWPKETVAEAQPR